VLFLAGCAGAGAIISAQAPATDRPGGRGQKEKWENVRAILERAYEDPMITDVLNIEAFVASYNKMPPHSFLRVPDRAVVVDNRSGGVVKIYYIVEGCIVTVINLPRQIYIYLSRQEI